MTITLVAYNHDPDPADTEFESIFVYIIKKGNRVEVVEDRHRLGIFSSRTWRKVLKEVGFDVHEILFEGEDFPLLVCVNVP